jgi:hypothetical protein
MGQDNPGRIFHKEDTLKSLKAKLPENSLFNINSLIFNLKNNKEEVVSKYNCFYNPSLEAFCIIVEEGTRYTDLSKEIVLNLMTFAQKVGVKNLILLLDRTNRDYVKILQGMMTVGFNNDAAMKTCHLGDKDYKILRMTMNTVQEEVEEVSFF